MIDYSIKKPHALCGHFIKINNEAEKQEIKAIAEWHGFTYEVCYSEVPHPYLHFCNSLQMRKAIHEHCIGQEITLPELRQLAELAKIELPCEMEVWQCNDQTIRMIATIVDFYKGKAVTMNSDGSYITWMDFLQINTRENEIKAKIKEHEEAIKKLNEELNTK